MPRVIFEPSSRCFLLEGAASSYAFAITADGTELLHLHWGTRLTPPDLPRLVAGALEWPETPLTWGGERPLEATPWGGLRYDEPSFKVDFPDGNRALEWQYETHRIEDGPDGTTVLEVELVDPAYPLSVVLCYRVFEDTPVIERWARVHHRGAEGRVVLRQALSASWWLPHLNQPHVRYLHGGWGRETQLTGSDLDAGRLVLDSRRGTTSHQLNPWVALSASAGEEAGEVWSAALAWSGSWKIVVERTPDGATHVVGGINDFDCPLELGAGETLELPVFAGLYCDGGYGATSRAWHDYQRRHILTRPHRIPASPSFPTWATSGATDGPTTPALRPVLYNSWEATTFDVSAAGQADLAKRAAAIGVELFVVDDGWFVGRRHDRAGLGDWVVDREKFPAGLDPLIEEVNDLGMRFGLWVEPEMVNPDSDLYRAHPDWVLHFPARRRSEKRHQLVLNLARPDVADWVLTTLDRLLSTHRIDFVKWDMNRHFSEPGWPGEVGHNPERVWVDYVRQLYRILEQLRSAHPEVDIESCSGGGGRVDLGMLSRVQQVWTSDNTDAWDRVAIQEGFGQVYAPIAMMAWVTDSPNPLTRRVLPLSYRFHVAMSGSLGIGGDLTRWSDAELAEARELIELYKSIRPVVQLGRLYRLESGTNGPLGAVEYVSEDGREVVVFAYWGVRRFDPKWRRLRLRGLQPDATYEDRLSPLVGSGRLLGGQGLPLGGPLDFGSRVWHLVRTDGTADSR
jgi:alpha-galactosidase